MRINKGRARARHNVPVTHEGGPAYPEISPDLQLRRTVLACLLWEDTFYESGQTIAERISATAKLCTVQSIAKLCVEARAKYKLRHVPLWLLIGLIERGRGSRVVQDAIYETIKRPDEMGELLAMYWKDAKKGKRKPLSAQLKKGLRRAFTKFDRYQLQKYDRDHAVRLRDVMFLTHPKPYDKAMEDLYKGLAAKATGTADTWESRQSAAGGDKAKRKENWADLILQKKLGYMALLRNLRNMEQDGVDQKLVDDAIRARRGAGDVLPFRFVSALKHAPRHADALDAALVEHLRDVVADDKRTVVLVDVSGSMDSPLGGKTEMSRMEAAATLAIMVPGQRKIFAFSSSVKEVDARGLRGVQAIINSMGHGGTNLAAAIQEVNRRVPHDRIIVITDEQSHDGVADPVCASAYMINVAAYRNGVGYGRWVHIDGFSEATLRYIAEYETAMSG